jgi:hypothetical protein
VKCAFFSEEKKQKTFTSLSRAVSAMRTIKTKVFWFPQGGRRLFSKKELLPARACRPHNPWTDLYDFQH